MGDFTEAVLGGGNGSSPQRGKLHWTPKDTTWRPQSNVEWRRSFARLPSELRALVHRGAPNSAFPGDALREYKHEIQQGRALLDQEGKSREEMYGHLPKGTRVKGGRRNTHLGKEAWTGLEAWNPDIAAEVQKIGTPEDFEEYMADVRVGLMEELPSEDDVLDAEAQIRSAWYYKLPPETRKAMRENIRPSFSKAVLEGD